MEKKERLKQLAAAKVCLSHVLLCEVDVMMEGFGFGGSGASVSGSGRSGMIRFFWMCD